MSGSNTPWAMPMPEDQFAFMRSILAAPSPVGFEGAMTFGVLEPFFQEIMPEGWKIHRFRGNSGVVLDSHPGGDDLLSVMVVGHADKIRMQVRSIGEDGKIWIDSDSFLPCTLIGHEVALYSEDPKKPGSYRVVEGGTVEAIGAIHFAPPELRKGDAGIKPNMLYLELQVHGEKRKEQVEKLGVRPGDPILLKREIRRGFSKDTFYGAYLDNGLGCFVAAELARLVAQSGGFKRVRTLFAMAAQEEIGRMGSRVLAGELRPDVLIGVDVNHDYDAAPNVGDRRMTPLAMGKGFTFTGGSLVSEHLNSLLETAAREKKIPFQKGSSGRDTGTDAMASALAGVDSAATSVGIPIRNMHTISETGHTGDVLAAIHGLFALLQTMEAKGLTAEDLRKQHPRLDRVEKLRPQS